MYYLADLSEEIPKHMNIHQKFSNSIAQIYIICVYLPIYAELGLLCLHYKRKPTILRKVNPTFPYG